jgi:triosephosphate isomerase
LTPIVCVGETLEQRESGATMRSLVRNSKQFWKNWTLQNRKNCRSVRACVGNWYGQNGNAGNGQEVHAFLRQVIASFSAEAAATVKILYGGSMKPDNAAELLRQTDIDGGLIGGAALKANDFLAIIAV